MDLGNPIYDSLNVSIVAFVTSSNNISRVHWYSALTLKKSCLDNARLGVACILGFLFIVK